MKIFIRAFGVKILCCMVSCLICAEERALVIENIDEGESSRLRVVDDGSNVSVRPGLNPGLFENTPDSVLAARLADRSSVFGWRPRWCYRGVNGVRLPGIALSSDGSVLAVVETVGDGDGPFSSRIVYYNTYNWEVIRISVFDRLRIVSAAFMARDEGLLTALVRRQAVFEQVDDLLLIIDGRSGEILWRKPVVSAEKTVVVSSGKFMLVKEEDSAVVDVYEPGTGVEVVSREGFEVGIGRVAFAFWRESGLAAVASSGRVLTVDVNTARVLFESTVPGGAEVADVIFAGSGERIALSLKNGQTLLYDKGMRREFGRGGGGLLFYDDGGVLWIEDLARQSLTPWDMERMSPSRGVKPGTLTPRTMGYMLFCAFLPGGRFVGVSSFGDIMELTPDRNRWRKRVVVSAMR